MKKFLILVLSLIIGTAAFAYEPKLENVKVRRNGDVVYHEKTETYRHSVLNRNRNYVRFVIRKGYTIEQLVDYQYQRLDSFRDSYINFTVESWNPKPDHLSKAIAEIGGNKESPEEIERRCLQKLAKKAKDTAIHELAFVTEENFLRLTKAELLAKVKAFVEEARKTKENK